MNEKMRRKDRETTEERAYEILKNGEYGILSTIGEDGYPVSYTHLDVYKRQTLFRKYRVPTVYRVLKSTISTLRLSFVR